MEESASQFRDHQRPVAPWSPTTAAKPDLGERGPTDALKQLPSEEGGFPQGNAIAGGGWMEGNHAFQAAESQSFGGVVGPFSGLLGLAMSGNYNALEREMMHSALNADLEAPIFGLESQGCSLHLGLNPFPLPEAPNCANADRMYPAFPYDLNAPATDAINTSILGSGTPDLSQNIGGISSVSSIAETFELQKNPSELVDNQASTMTGENFEPEKSLGEQIDLSKTPGKKPRKKKHRPKVVVEGKKPRNPRTPKPTNLNGVETPKRKYVRKNSGNKPVDGALEGDANGAREEGQAPGAEVSEESRQRYVRQNKVDQSPAPLEDGITTSTNTTRVSQRSCRKSLNFRYESQEEWGGGYHNQPASSSSVRRRTSRKSLNFGIGSQVEEIRSQAEERGRYSQSHSDFEIKYSEGKAVLVEKTKGDPVQAAPSDYPFVKEGQAYTATSCLSSQFTGPNQIDDQVAMLKTCVAGNAKRSASRFSRSCGTSQEIQARESKRSRLSTTDAMDPSNVTGAGSCSVLAYQQIIMPAEHRTEQISNMHSPAAFKNQSGATSYQSASSSLPPTHHIYPSDDKAFQSDSMVQIMGNDFKSLPSVGIAGKIRRKRSKGMTRARNTHSLLEDVRQLPISGNGKGAFRGSRGPHACMEALADFSRTWAKKKRSNRIIFGSASVSYDHHRSATDFFGVHSGSSQDAMRRGKSMIDAIIEQFSYLSIEGRSSQINYQEANAWQNSLVLYQNNGAMVPFEQFKKRKQRPKVELDEETTRVWKLLLEDINSEGVDGTDAQKAKWWENEREVFRLRTESFIARMHLVQGDRRFTPWKGSVLDSVVGVFLTQNVSDHLSSSAFISMAARYPLKSSNIHVKSPLSEKRSEEPEVVEPNEEVEWSKEESSPVARIHGSMTLPDKKCREEEISTRVFLGISSEGTTTACPSSLSSLSSGCGTKLYNEADANRFGPQNNEMPASFTGHQKEPGHVISSQNSVASPHYSIDSVAQRINRCESSSQSSTEAEPTDAASTHPSFVELLHQMAEPNTAGYYYPGVMKAPSYSESSMKSKGPCNFQGVNLGSQETITSNSSRFFFKETELSATEQSTSPPESSAGTSFQNSPSQKPQVLIGSGDKEPAARVQKHKIGEGLTGPSSSGSGIDDSGKGVTVDIEKNQKGAGPSNLAGTAEAPEAPKEKKTNAKKKKVATDWDFLRKKAEVNGKKERPFETMDSVDWERVRCADVDEIAYTIRERGMNNMLAERIKEFLNRIVKEHGSLDLEWLRDVEPDRAKEFLLSVRGLGLKSVECVRLLTLHHLAFPVDTNVGRIAVRLGWVPLQPLPESLQLHLLELYPVLETIQKYLWPRLCKLDQPTLYELHYQLITFGKVFCTKSKPNCNACPMRAECRHFASAYASARLALPAPEERSVVSATRNESSSNKNVSGNSIHLQLPQPETIQQLEGSSQIRPLGPFVEEPASPEPIIEVPASPEPEKLQPEDGDIEEYVHEDETDIPEIKLNLEELNQTLQDYIQMHIQVQDSEMSKALVVVDANAASLPMPKLKSINRLRTEHQVYELPDTHPLLKGFERREPDDPSPYLLAIWTPGETVDSIKPPESTCSCFQDSGKLCNQQTCFSCNSIREAKSQTVRGTLLIPCRTAMRGSFPLNGTYFQVNEMFADHESSLNPISVPRDWLWNLPRRMVYFGTSVPSIFKGLTQSEIQFCFWKGFVCVRGFDKRNRSPRPLIARLHFPASKLKKERGDE